MLDRESKFNTINSDFAWKLGFKIWKTNVEAQNIDGFVLETFKIIIADFQIKDKISRPRFFQEIFLVADTKFEVILRILFFKFSNADILFCKKTLT